MMSNSLADFNFATLWWIAEECISTKWKLNWDFVPKRWSHPGLCTNNCPGSATVPMLFGSSKGPGWALRVKGVDGDAGRETRFRDALRPLTYTDAVNANKVWRNETQPALPQHRHDELRDWLYRQRPKSTGGQP